MRQDHTGRLIDHVHLRVRGLEAAKRFYKAVLDALGTVPWSEGEDHLEADELWIDQGESPSRVHLAFQAMTGKQCAASMRRPWRPAERTTARPASVAIIRAITRRSCSTPTATTSRPSVMGQSNRALPSKSKYGSW